jgi:hypothetical protein
MPFNKNTGTLNLNFPLLAVPAPAGGSAIVSPRVGSLWPGTEALAATIPTGGTLTTAMAEVSSVREQVVQGIWPAAFLAGHHHDPAFDGSRVPKPLVMAGVLYNFPLSAANLVRMDHWTDLGKYCEKWLYSVGATPKNATGHIDFVEEAARFARLAQRIADALEAAFQAKYYHGAIRPEEFHSLPGAVYTAYTEGCPAHPESPAGHGSVSGATAAHIKEEWNLTPDQIKEIDDAAFHFRHYRTFAGVHVAFANDYGAEIGRLVAEASF